MSSPPVQSLSAAVGEAAAAHAVQEMFDTIAPTYDRANHLLSAGIDRYWWTRAARAFRPILARPDARILDLCCGNRRHGPPPPQTPSSPTPQKPCRPERRRSRSRRTCGSFSHGTSPQSWPSTSPTRCSTVARRSLPPSNILPIESRRPAPPHRVRLARPRHLRLRLPQPRQLRGGPRRTLRVLRPGARSAS